MDGPGKTLVQFQVERLDNDTFLATLVSKSNASLLHGPRPYDDEGALYYVVAVVFIYGFSIILMIGSLIKRNKADNGVSKYMKDMDKVRRMERRQLKYQTRLAMSAAGGNSRRASRATAARTASLHRPDMAPLSAPPETQRCSSAFPWDQAASDWLAGGGSDTERVTSTCSLLSSTDESSPRIPLLAPQPPKSPSGASPRSSPGPGRAVLCRERTIEMLEETAGATLAPNQRTNLIRSTALSPPAQPMGCVEGAPTVLYMENERENKCKVSVAQLQLDTLHEVDEEHTGGDHSAGKIYHV